LLLDLALALFAVAVLCWCVSQPGVCARLLLLGKAGCCCWTRALALAAVLLAAAVFRPYVYARLLLLCRLLLLLHLALALLLFPAAVALNSGVWRVGLLLLASLLLLLHLALALLLFLLLCVST